MFYPVGVRAEYRLEPCTSALNPVRGMPFRWSLNPYMGCVHRYTFCYVEQSFPPWDEERKDDVHSVRSRHRAGEAAELSGP